MELFCWLIIMKTKNIRVNSPFPQSMSKSQLSEREKSLGNGGSTALIASWNIILLSFINLSCKNFWINRTNWIKICLKTPFNPWNFIKCLEMFINHRKVCLQLFPDNFSFRLWMLPTMIKHILMWFQLDGV